MKHLQRTLRRLVLPLLGASLLTAAPASASAPVPLEPAPAATLQDGQAEWRAAFNKAMAVGATSEMERLVKKNQFQAIEWIIETAQSIAVASSEDLEDRMAALRKSWKAATNSDFADNMYTYFSLLGSIQREERIKLKVRYDKQQKRYFANVQKKDKPTWGVLWTEFTGLAGAFQELGDYYFASQAWLMAYNTVNELNRGDDADLYKACEALGGAVEMRAKVDLKDRSYAESKTTYEYLKANGYDDAGGGGGGDEPGDGGPPKAGPSNEGPAVSVSMTFEMVEDVSRFQRPSYVADELHNLWSRVYLEAKGGSATFSTLGALSPKVTRTNSMEALIDADGDGEGEISWPLRGNIEPVTFKIGSGAEEREWGFLTTIGTPQDMYQGIVVNMVPTEDQMSLYIVGGASMVGEVNGVQIRIIDENMDGIYGSAPVQWGYDGVTEGMLHPEMDSILIGSGKRARPWSEYQEIGGVWYRLEVENAGKSLKAYPVEIETGAIKLTYKGGKPTWVVVKGSGKYENSFFDLMEKGIGLPPGKWTLFCGELRKGKKIQTMKTLILPGKDTPSWRVEVGGTAEASLGAPFGFDFKFEEDGKNMMIPGNSIVVTGVAGERYERPWNCVPKPAASYRKVGEKKGSKPEGFRAVGEQEELNKDGWSVAWFPKDLEIKKKSADKSEVQLTEKKNKLFGKIESTWKD